MYVCHYNYIVFLFDKMYQLFETRIGMILVIQNYWGRIYQCVKSDAHKIWKTLWYRQRYIGDIMVPVEIYWRHYGAGRDILETLWYRQGHIGEIMVPVETYWRNYGAGRYILETLWCRQRYIGDILAQLEIYGRYHSVVFNEK